MLEGNPKGSSATTVRIYDISTCARFSNAPELELVPLSRCGAARCLDRVAVVVAGTQAHTNKQQFSQDVVSTMSALSLVNPNAESIRRAQALLINVNAAKGLQEVMKTNLGSLQAGNCLVEATA